MDNTLPFNLRSVSTNFFNVAGILVVVCVAIPVFTAALVPIAILFYLIQGADSIALILLGRFFSPSFETAYCISTQSKKFMHMFLAN